jgi:hypothetical protein
MYGLVNKAIEGLVTQEYGVETWNKIKSKAGFDEVSFVSMKAYPDSLTYGLIGAASEELGVDGSTLLELFGEYWILYTANEGYGEMLNIGGNSLPEFISNLNMLHFRLGNMMPEMIMPQFETKDVTENSLVLIYKSTRTGLAPMVIGIIRGLGKRFNTPCVIEQIESFENEVSEEHFTVKW